jgi:hypothetical protein
MSLAGAIQFKILPCCPENGTEAIINISGTLTEGETGVYKYTGSGLSIPGTDVTFVTGACYTIARLTTIGNVTDVPASDFTGYFLNSRCDDPTVEASCPDCSPDPGNYYIKAVPCCGGDAIFFKGEGYTGLTGDYKDPTLVDGKASATSPAIPQFSINNYNGVYLFLGFAQQVSQNSSLLEVGQCYTFSFNSVSDPSSEITPAEYDALGYPPYISQLDFVSKTDCDTLDVATGERICPDCKEICYRLTNCDGTVINTVQDLSLYVNTYIELSGYTGSWLVQINEGICQDPSRTLKISGTGATPCPCLCYEVIGNSGAINYIDCDGNSQTTIGPAKFCSQTPPLIKGVEGVDYTLITGVDCVDGECVEQCFLLTNCDPTAYPDQDATLVSTLQSLSSYVGTNSVVVLAGYEGCWTVTEAVECECPVDVTVIRDYVDCDDCLGITAYKLFNCEKINEVIYTTQDFSAYVGQVIKDDCACWVVEEIDYQPPSETTIVDPILFTDCTTCLTTYYQLDDCDSTSPVPIIITSTNLAGYVGSVVQIDGCTGCYTVSLYAEETQPANSQEVTVTLDFPDCPTCGTVTPKCSTVFNTTTEDQTYTFINANGDSEVTDVVKSGHSSLRYCVQRWDDSINPEGIFNFYGDCTVYENELRVKTGFCVQYFPNNRKVKPGYNTPICSADKYDKITCNAADIMYKKVLELRYGISDCCPEENEKWLISKELIELQALTDPNYTCDPLTDCCGNPTSQCSCNS